MMKRILVVLAMVPMFAAAAEVAPGTIQVTGNSNLGFATGSEKTKVTGAPESKVDGTQFDLGARSLYYVIKDLGVGLDLSYGFESQKFEATAGGANKNSSATLQIGPAIEYSYPVAEKASVFGFATVGYVTETDKGTTDGVDDPDVKRTGFGYELAVGAKYFFTKSFSLDGSVGYASQTVSEEVTGATGPKPDITTAGFGLNVGLSVYFGQ
ncbi:MAG TPA: outer membrane beta-barrel protein [Candidatus Limnocylindria bacterium]|nr:outer membrane beta-barrel protein [Candidatus Limnocylindria bacterium]